MKPKHLAIRIAQCNELAKASNCPRRGVGAQLLDPRRNVVLMDGYNGGPRGGGRLCGGEECLRDTQGVESGTRLEIGCHHAEMNVICNAAAAGISTDGAWMIVQCEPCLMCAKLIHHCGIVKVIVTSQNYRGDGVEYLTQNGIEIEHPDIETCVYCGKAAEGNHTIHETPQGMQNGEGPEVPLCDACGSGPTPTTQDIWEHLRQKREAGT